MCIHFIYWVSRAKPGWALTKDNISGVSLTFADLKLAGPENFRQKTGRVGPKKQRAWPEP